MEYNLIVKCIKDLNNFLFEGNIYEADWWFDSQNKEYRLIVRHNRDTGVCISLNYDDYFNYVEIL